MGVQNGTVLFKSQISNLYLCVCFFNVKGSSMPIYTKNINIWVPCNCYKMKTLTRVRTCQNFGNGLLKSDLTFGYLTCSVQSKKISLIHPTVLYSAKSENYISENPKIRIQRRVTVDSTLYGTAQSWITLSPGPE